jgi:hypothetical protein
MDQALVDVVLASVSFCFHFSPESPFLGPFSPFQEQQVENYYAVKGARCWFAPKGYK